VPVHEQSLDLMTRGYLQRHGPLSTQQRTTDSCVRRHSLHDVPFSPSNFLLRSSVRLAELLHESAVDGRCIFDLLRISLYRPFCLLRASTAKSCFTAPQLGTAVPLLGTGDWVRDIEQGLAAAAITRRIVQVTRCAHHTRTWLTFCSHLD